MEQISIINTSMEMIEYHKNKIAVAERESVEFKTAINDLKTNKELT